MVPGQARFFQPAARCCALAFLMMLFCMVLFWLGLLFFVTRGYVWTIPASSCKHFDSKTLLCIMIGDDNVSIRLVLFFWGGSFGLRGFESIAILRSEFARGMVQSGWSNERLG